MTLTIGRVSLPRKVWVISTCVLLVVFSPVLLLLFTSLALIRHVLTLYKRIFHPELGPFLNGMDAMLSRASPYIGEPVSNISYYLVLDGHLQLSELRRVVQKGLNKMESESKSKTKLKQYVTEWAGFILCADEPHFQIEHHVRMLDFKELSEQWKLQCPQNAQPLHSNRRLLQLIQGEGNSNSNSNTITNMSSRHWNEEELVQLAFELTSVPYNDKTSPWEVLLLHNPPPPKSQSNPNSKGTSVLMLRIHHSYTDAGSCASLLSHFLDQDQEFSFGRTLKHLSRDVDNDKAKDKEKEQGQNQGFLKNSIDQVGTALKLCAEVPRFFNEVFESWDDNIWHPSFSAIPRSKSMSGNLIAFEITMAQLRTIKERYQQTHKKDGTTPIPLTTPAIFLAATSLGIRDYMMNHLKVPRENIPETVSIQTGLALPRTRNEITNQFVFLPVQIPIRSDSTPDPHTLMTRVQKEYSRIKNSSFSRVGPALSHLTGMLPTFVQIPPALLFTTGVLTNNPVFENPVSVNGLSVIAVEAASSLPVSLAFATLTYGFNDRMKVVFHCQDHVFNPRGEAQAFVKCVEKQLVNFV